MMFSDRVDEAASRTCLPDEAALQQDKLPDQGRPSSSSSDERSYLGNKGVARLQKHPVEPYLEKAPFCPYRNHRSRVIRKCDGNFFSRGLLEMGTESFFRLAKGEVKLVSCFANNSS